MVGCWAGSCFEGLGSLGDIGCWVYIGLRYIKSWLKAGLYGLSCRDCGGGSGADLGWVGWGWVVASQGICWGAWRRVVDSAG